MTGYMQLTDVYITAEENLQRTCLEQADMYLAEAGKLDSNPPGPLRPCSGWISEVCKVRVSWCCCLFYHAVCAQGRKQTGGQSLIVQYRMLYLPNLPHIYLYLPVFTLYLPPPSCGRPGRCERWGGQGPL